MQKIVKLWDQKQPENKKNKLKVATEQTTTTVRGNGTCDNHCKRHLYFKGRRQTTIIHPSCLYQYSGSIRQEK